MATMNQYTDITDYYDLLVTQGYYNYQGMAEAVYSLMQGNEKVLDLGVGAGLLAEELLKLDRKYLLSQDLRKTYSKYCHCHK